MRFFTNENKDEDVKDRDGDATDSSDTVALPHQRGNSPWSSTPDTDASGIHRRDDDPPIEDPTPPDHAVADTSPDAVPSDTTHADTTRFDATDSDTTHADPTGSDPTGSDTTHADADRSEATGTAAVPDVPAARALDDDTVTTDGKDATLRDDGGFDDPEVGDDPKVADEPDKTDGTALKDDGGFDDPKAVDPVTDAPLKDHDDTRDHDTTDDTPVVAAPAIDAQTVDEAEAVNDTKPGEIDSPEVTTIFNGDDAKAFQDRWRDVQLRFVDSPKEATAEAAALVDDAVEKLTASLRSQKEGFGGESTEDTEKLRVELRGYRDLFNRIIGL
ncbi:hypothetical protein [Actinoplanes sp. NBRC 103695]|uniref:hypothetical protein n=1 Tax=Actinoplanes sp. NBRC 103695 TaxID=3032202 RepID=UPI0024A0946E|nr:hypothetical protein [Actinoplanes sp. NBRC 103695]GLY96716.1 hypothetical protein Acsp02_39700 [Actinoplanes sp. NBRC 103695]